MKPQDQAIHDLNQALAERRKLLFQATLLDQDNRPLAKGEAIIEAGRGVFWPNPPERQDIQPSNAVTLRRSDETSIALFHFRLCPAHSSSVHYHFQTEE
jgi:hypothetical protein